MKADTKWVHHPHTDILFITIRIGNSIIHRMLVDKGNAANICFWDTYRKTVLPQADLSPMTSPLYGFTGDHLIPRGTINLAVTLGEHPRVSTTVTIFLAIDCQSASNGVIGRPLLRALKVVT